MTTSLSCELKLTGVTSQPRVSVGETAQGHEYSSSGLTKWQSTTMVKVAHLFVHSCIHQIFFNTLHKPSSVLVSGDAETDKQDQFPKVLALDVKGEVGASK